jgi:hypothetical protein
MAQERILISSGWGKVNAELADNAATRSLVHMLPLTIEMSDHLRQEMTGNLPSPLPGVERQLDFSTCVYRKLMYGRRPRCKREIDYQRSVRVRSCIRPLNAAA